MTTLGYEIDAEVHALFNVERIICVGCGFEYDPAESEDWLNDDDPGAPYTSALAFALNESCPDCHADEFREIEVNLLDELVLESRELGAICRWVVKQKPELRERVEEMLAGAREAVDLILPGAA